MNNRGQTMIYGLMLGLVVIILALALAPVVINSASNASAPSGDALGLDCANTSIDVYTKATCEVVDLSPFYFIGTMICIGGAVVTAKILFST